MSHQYNLSHNLHNNVLVPNTTNPQKAVEYINSHIEKVHCENVSVDLSFLNILDACYVTTMCSTKHYIKYPHGKINWIVSSSLVEEFNCDMSLGNSEYTSY